MERLLAAGVDQALARHISHIFNWDPLLVFSESLKELEEQNGKENDNGQQHRIEDGLEHFDSIQSSIWSSLRFKPPPSTQLANRLGWRVEFRPMEVQLTDFENAAFCCFLVLLSRVLLSDHLSLVLPISLIDENMERAQGRDAVLKQRFHFRTDLERHGDRKKGHQNGHIETMNGHGMDEEATTVLQQNGHESTVNIREMTINEIINGFGC